MRGARGGGVRRLAILVVDDEEDILELLSEMLRGHEVVRATGCEEAEAVMLRRGASLDAVVSDYRMPGRNGAEVLRAAMQHSPRAVRALLTACPPSDVGDLVDAGVVHFCLLKTFINALRGRLEAIVSSAEGVASQAAPG